MSRAAVLLVALVTLLTACGSAGDEPATSAPPTTQPPATTQAPPVTTSAEPVEWTRESADAPFTETASGEICTSCHMGAAGTDYVWITTLGLSR